MKIESSAPIPSRLYPSQIYPGPVCSSKSTLCSMAKTCTYSVVSTVFYYLTLGWLLDLFRHKTYLMAKLASLGLLFGLAKNKMSRIAEYTLTFGENQTLVIKHGQENDAYEQFHVFLQKCSHRERCNLDLFRVAMKVTPKRSWIPFSELQATEIVLNSLTKNGDFFAKVATKQSPEGEWDEKSYNLRPLIEATDSE